MVNFFIALSIVVLFVLGAVLLLKDNAKKFKLSDEQKQRIEERNKAFEQEDNENS